jgi:hypothetical protein
MSDEDAEDAKARVMNRISEVIETLTPEDAQSFLAILHADVEDLMSVHEEEHPELYE